jgi:SAM-dependent methyltransferase
MGPADRSPTLEATGERLVPHLQHGQLVHAEHLARYRLAAQLAAECRVLDAACGEGYGTAMLASAGAASAVGVDRDERTIEHALERYGLDFRVAEVLDMPFDDGSFDLVVSFETIEHVRDPGAALDEFARVMAPRGLLLLSTPNKHQYLVDNEFHEREFTHEEFVALLRARFRSVRILYQHNWMTSAVLEEEGFSDASGRRALELEATKVRGSGPGGELYTIALCGEDTDGPLRQVAVLAGVDEAHSLARQLEDARRTAEHWHSAYLGEQQIAKDWHGHYEDAERRFQEAMESMRWMAGTLSWRLTKPFRAPAKLLRRWRAR